jgi:hypothetical protein
MSDEGDKASSTTAETPAHQQRQQCHHDESDNCHHNNGKDTCTLMVITPSQQVQHHQLNKE